VITWFAGLFYIPRLFVYQIEAHQEEQPVRGILLKQLKLMTRRLWYIITWPSAILATVFAVYLLILNPAWLEDTWMHVKLGFVVLLFIYHGKTQQIFKQLENDDHHTICRCISSHFKKCSKLDLWRSRNRGFCVDLDDPF